MIKFTDLNLDTKVLKAIADAGYETPTPIQAGAIPPALEGKRYLRDCANRNWKDCWLYFTYDT